VLSLAEILRIIARLLMHIVHNAQNAYAAWDNGLHIL
jgi:hypothetical protein